MASPFKTLSSKTVFKGRRVDVRVDQAREPGGVEAERELVVHPGSVVVLPVFGDGRVLLVRQFRYAAGQALWELVAGGLEPGEKPLAAAARELAEETGFRATRFRRVLSFYPSPGILSEKMHLVEARGLTPGVAQPEKDERILARIFTLAELRKMARGGRIQDGKTLAGLFWLLDQS